MKNTLPLIICLIVTILIAALALYTSHQQQKQLQAENDQLRQQIIDDQKYTGIGRITSGIFNTIASGITAAIASIG